MRVLDYMNSSYILVLNCAAQMLEVCNLVSACLMDPFVVRVRWLKRVVFLLNLE